MYIYIYTYIYIYMYIYISISIYISYVYPVPHLEGMNIHSQLHQPVSFTKIFRSGLWAFEPLAHPFRLCGREPQGAMARSERWAILMVLLSLTMVNYG